MTNGPSQKMTLPANWPQLEALALGALIDDGAIDPVSLTEAVLERVSRFDPLNRIVWHGSEDRALTEAIAAHDRARKGLRRSPLDGVPIAWKDNVEAVGAPTTNGSRLLKNHLAPRDATVLARAVRAGAVTLGKTALTEFAFSGLGFNPTMGSPGNAFDRTRLPGGSSCGSAVAVARGLAPLAVGTDTAGSIRIPASWNGLVGLKPTPGAVPMDGILPLSRQRDVVGPIARNVADANAFWALMTGHPAPDIASPKLKGTLFLAPPEFLTEADPDVATVFGAALARFESAGARIDHATLPVIADVQIHADENGNSVSAEGWAEWGALISANPSQVYDNVRIRMEKGAAGFDGVRFARTMRELAELTRTYIMETAQADAVILPTVMTLPPPIKATDDPARYSDINLKALRFTRVANMLGLPAITLPCGMALASGDRPALPVGLTLMGAPHSEARLLRLAAAMEHFLPKFALPIS